MKLRFLTKSEACAYWETLEPLFEKVVNKAVHGEYTVEDIYQMAKDGDIHICIGVKNNKIVIAGAFEILHYPNGKMGANWLAMGGEQLNEFMLKCVPPFKKWCRENGVNWIECNVSRGMERIHHRYGFKTMYRNLRMGVEE